MAWSLKYPLGKGTVPKDLQKGLKVAGIGAGLYFGLPALGGALGLTGSGGALSSLTAGEKLLGLGTIGGVGASLYGSKINSDAIGQAGEMQLQGTREAIAAQQKAMEEQRALYEPYRQLGLEALPKLRESLTSTPQDSPLYKWQLEKGLEQLRGRNASYRGGYLKQLESDYVSRLNAEESDKQYGRIRDIAGLGAGITGQQAGAEQQYGGALANLQYQGGMGQANIASERGQARNSMYQVLGENIVEGGKGYLAYTQGLNTQNTLQQQIEELKKQNYLLSGQSRYDIPGSPQ